MPSEVSISGAHHDREPTVEELKRELAQSREQQAVTAEILATISSSATDTSQVFAKIAASAARLCDAHDSTIFQVDGDNLRMVAHHGPIPTGGTLPLTWGIVTADAVLDRRTIHVPDLRAEYDKYPEGSDHARLLGHRTILAVPLIRAGEAIGAIGIRRTEVRPFTDGQIDLLRTFADQAVIAIENTRLFETEQASKRELQESLEYQTATSAVLNVISRSKRDVQPVFDAIVRSAAELFDPCTATITVREGNQILWRASAAAHNADRVEQMGRMAFPVPYNPECSPSARAMQERRIIEIPDVSELERNALIPAAREFTRTLQAAGVCSIAFVPLLLTDEGIGTIILGHPEPGFRLSQKQRALVQTFADQAVIAIENARLFEAEQARTRELSEALEQQTATAEVLKVISRSALDLQRVLDALVESAARLCNANDALIFQVSGDGLRLVAHHGQIPMPGPVGQHTLPLVRGVLAGRAVIDRRTIQVADILAETDEYPESRKLALPAGWRTGLCVPLIHAGEAIGVISIRRTEVHPFIERQIELVNTFADQAVIAIENTRLFDEVQARTRDATEALEYQTATSDVLETISRSPTDARPVFDMIAKSAARLCAAQFCHVFSFDGEMIHVAALHGHSAKVLEAARSDYPMLPGRGSAAARAIASVSIEEISDVHADPEYAHGDIATIMNIGAIVAVPMLKDNRPIGAIAVARSQSGRFPVRQIELLKTFADQAVIAIENTRLFEAEQARTREVTERTRELTEALEQQTATADVLKVISRSALDLERVLDALVESAARLCDAYDAVIFQVFDDGLRLVAHHGQIPTTRPVGQYTLPLVRGFITGRAVIDRRTIHVADMQAEADEYPESRALPEGWRTALAVPLVHAGEAIGVILIRRAEMSPFTERQIELVNTFADQAVIAIENTRLFNEIAQKSRELEIASQHKSQFVANMSHELRTPLAAILGYAELMQEGFYEPLGQKSMDALTRIRSNGKHLLGLINTVLDIAKIESGQFTLNMAEYALESVVETVRSATESLAQSKQLELKTEVAKPLPIGLGDEQRLTQVLLNLVGNALKFTDSGEVRVTAKAVNGHFNLSVADTGPGIPAEHQTRIFDQFHQVDSSNTKAKGGTGLGLAIAKQIVEMHGGRIWVESTLGKGSTFQMELPTRAEFRKMAP